MVAVAPAAQNGLSTAREFCCGSLLTLVLALFDRTAASSRGIGDCEGELGGQGVPPAKGYEGDEDEHGQDRENALAVLAPRWPANATGARHLALASRELKWTQVLCWEEQAPLLFVPVCPTFLFPLKLSAGDGHRRSEAGGSAEVAHNIGKDCESSGEVLSTSEAPLRHPRQAAGQLCGD